MGEFISAFDANGATNCSGTPKVCQPLWTSAPSAGFDSSPSIANGVVYASALNDKLYAFDANGTTITLGMKTVSAGRRTRPPTNTLYSARSS